MLPPAAGDHAAEGPPVLEECAVGKLVSTVAGDKLLDHDLPGPNQLQRLLETVGELRPTVGSPGLDLGGVDEMLLDGRLDRQRELAFDLVQLARVARPPRSGGRNTQ